MDYEQALFSPDISWDELTKKILIPKKLYKYQNFINENGSENPYWSKNINGQFHLSLACEFEDSNDCKPIFNKDSVLNHIKDFFCSLNENCEIRDNVLREISCTLTEEYFDSVISNYQNNIRIGCFTDSSDNEPMWTKYAYKKTGYCIEYDTSKNKLFQLSTLPVLYKEKGYDCSFLFAISLIMDLYREAKNYTLMESSKIFNDITKKILKTTYIPIFVKQKEHWEFEREYRMFLLKHRTTRDGILKASQCLDDNYNIDLADSVNAIYLGEKFNTLNGSDEILKKVIFICKNKKIGLFHKTLIEGKIQNVKLL